MLANRLYIEKCPSEKEHFDIILNELRNRKKKEEIFKKYIDVTYELYVEYEKNHVKYHYTYDVEMKVMIRLKWEDDEMILREALEKNNSDAIIDEIVKIRRSWFQDDLLIPSESKEIEGTKIEVQELLKLKKKNKSEKERSIAVVKRFDAHVTEKLNTVWKTYYDAYIVDVNESTFYGIEDMDWNDIIDYPINEKSIQMYGIVSCLASILYYLSWYGYEYKTSTENREKFLKKLLVSVKELESGKQETYELDIDKFREELGLEKERENEKKLRKENFQKMCEKNDKENKKIFGEDYSSIFKN